MASANIYSTAYGNHEKIAECELIPTILRIKRRLEDESADNIIVSAKKKKKDCNAVNSGTKLTKVATLQEEKFNFNLQNILQKELKHSNTGTLKESYKKHVPLPIKEKLRKNVLMNRAANCFKLTSINRKISLGDDKSSIEVVLFDVSEDDVQCKPSDDIITCNGQPMRSEKVEFVYDIYYTNTSVEINESWISNICEIKKQNLDYIYDGENSDESQQESDDENDEDNYRNEYPEDDEDDPQLGDYDDQDDFLCSQMKTFKIVDSDESYDATDYDGDFDEEGKQIIDHSTNKFLKLVAGMSSSSDEEG